jgi:regulator of protease activity HflC (stomatin/prohibitin superfamily)
MRREVVEEALSFLVMAVVALGLTWLLFALIGGFWTKYQNGHVTVYDHEAGLKIVEGRVAQILPAGRYATWPAPVEIERVDLRLQSLTIAGQEMLTADLLPVRVTVLVGLKVTDALALRAARSDWLSGVYEAAQVILRERVGRMALEPLLADRGLLTAGMAEELGARLGPIGVRIETVALRDLTLTGPAKQAFADLWKAKKEGEAALERARGEQASLRALANAARMLKGNPELMNLRILAAASGKPGAAPPTLVLGGAGGLLPVSSGSVEPAEAAGDGAT